MQPPTWTGATPTSWQPKSRKSKIPSLRYSSTPQLTTGSKSIGYSAINGGGPYGRQTQRTNGEPGMLDPGSLHF